jgi:hypothetical protein
MANNQPLRKYFTTTLLVSAITAGMSGGWAWFVGLVAPYIINFLAKKGIYFIDVGVTMLQTNMDKKTWETVMGSAWEEVDKNNLTPEEGKAIDEKVKKAFDKFAVFTKVKSDTAKP